MATLGLIPEAIHKYPQVSKYGEIRVLSSFNLAYFQICWYLQTCRTDFKADD